MRCCCFHGCRVSAISRLRPIRNGRETSQDHPRATTSADDANTPGTYYNHSSRLRYLSQHTALDPAVQPQGDRSKMASKAVIPFLVGMMLLTGVCNTLLTKYQVRTIPSPNRSVVCDAVTQMPPRKYRELTRDHGTTGQSMRPELR